ncbi:hypothetical protein [Streptomyces sp. NBC_01794]|uniref:hypothetical protein n=1 Tax=Streptomyces sp. NBC_01794 TaxID=2975942 RepID=UPI00308E097D|nr:hypothetical protein OIE54_01345 [Streptomyces sp. NBC_01794]
MSSHKLNQPAWAVQLGQLLARVHRGDGRGERGPNHDERLKSVVDAAVLPAAGLVLLDDASDVLSVQLTPFATAVLGINFVAEPLIEGAGVATMSS